MSAEVGGDAPRLEGSTRYGTSAAIVDASRDAGLRINQPWIATGESFADALVTGPAAAAAGQVVVLVDGGDLAGSAESSQLTLGTLAGQVDALRVVSTDGNVAESSVATLLESVQGPVPAG